MDKFNKDRIKREDLEKFGKYEKIFADYQHYFTREGKKLFD